MKVLWIDCKSESRQSFIKTFSLILISEGFEVSNFYWHHEDIRDIDKATEAVKGIDIVIVHFGSMARAEAAAILTKIKATGVKVIVISASSILFEEADAVTDMGELGPDFGTNLTKLIKSICS